MEGILHINFNIIHMYMDIIKVPLTISAAGLTLVGVSSSILMGCRRRLKRGKLWLPSNEQLPYSLRRRARGFTVLKVLKKILTNVNKICYSFGFIPYNGWIF